MLEQFRSLGSSKQLFKVNESLESDGDLKRSKKTEFSLQKARIIKVKKSLAVRNTSKGSNGKRRKLSVSRHH